jgi:hypothetical protein
MRRTEDLRRNLHAAGARPLSRCARFAQFGRYALWETRTRRFSRALAERGMVAFMVRYFDRTRTVFAGDQTIDEHLHA